MEPGEMVSVDGLIEDIVAAVRAGHDGRIGYLLRLFSTQADIRALLALRDALSLCRLGPGSSPASTARPRSR